MTSNDFNCARTVISNHEGLEMTGEVRRRDSKSNELVFLPFLPNLSVFFRCRCSFGVLSVSVFFRCQFEVSFVFLFSPETESVFLSILI